ncbi:MAG: glycosyltransferase family A protein, partial [Candidatus Korobacteraceae bacterium]
MSLSVVIPTYNASRFMSETLGSVFAQTRLPDEILVVDDASTDGTPAIVRELAAGAPVPLRLIEMAKNTGGPATPMNVGIEAARGEYVALLDHDDLMLPEKVGTQTLVLDRYPAVELVLSDFAILASHGVTHRDERWPWVAGEGAGNDGAQTLVILDPFACQMDLMTGNRLGVTCTNYFFRKSLWSRLSGFRTDASVATD